MPKTRAQLVQAFLEHPRCIGIFSRSTSASGFELGASENLTPTICCGYGHPGSGDFGGRSPCSLHSQAIDLQQFITI